MRCPIRVLPFLLHDRIPGEDRRRKYRLMLKIKNITYAPRWNLGHVAYLHNLQEERHRLRRELFPAQNEANKDHHQHQQPECIEKSGPLIDYDCMGHERFHNQMRKRAAVCCNFKNIAFTLAKTCQLYQCSVWSGRSPKIFQKYSFIRGAVEIKAHSHHAFDLMLDVGVLVGDVVTTVKSLSIHGTNYRKRVFVVIDGGNVMSDDPSFGVIKEIILFAGAVYALVSRWDTLLFDPDFEAYHT